MEDLDYLRNKYGRTYERHYEKHSHILENVRILSS